MTKATPTDAKQTRSTAGPLLQRAVADLEHEIVKSAAPDSTAGNLDSPLLIAIAKTLTAYVAWRLELDGA